MALAGSLAHHNRHRAAQRALFARGFLLMMPLWAGAIPAGAAYGVAALQVGLSPLETQLMSIIVFAAPAQISAVSLISEGTAGWLVVATAMALSAQLLLMGLTVSKQTRPTRGERFLTAGFLTDAAFGVSAAQGKLRIPLLLGAGVNMYVGWNIGTALGIAVGNALPDPQRLGIDLIVPLAFVAVLIPLLRTKVAALVALLAAGLALVLALILPSGVAVLTAGAIGSAAGAWLLKRSPSARPGAQQ